MSAIQNFKNRQLKKQVDQKQQIESATDNNTPKNEALTLLAKLLNVTEQDAIGVATLYVESNISFFAADPADGDDKSVLVEVTKDDDGNITHVEGTDIKTAIEESAEHLKTELSNTADAVQGAASDVESAASDLAYQTSDIQSATEELKEAAAEVKKPSEEAQKSSNGEKASKQQKSSKK